MELTEKTGLEGQLKIYKVYNTYAVIGRDSGIVITHYESEEPRESETYPFSKYWHKLVTHKKELIYDETNLVVTAAKQSLLGALVATSLTADPIVLLKVGTGGCIDSGGFYPKPEDPAQTDLITPIGSIATTYTPVSGEVAYSFLADVTSVALNGVMITEAGLFKQSGLIFNVKNHPGIVKTSAFSIHYEWTIVLL